MSFLEPDRRYFCIATTLRGKKAIAQERLDAYKYPVLTLPPEIVSEIFTHFLPTYPDCPPLTGTFSPTRLTHICRAWREISLGTPSLWRAVDLSPRAKVDPSPARLVQELDIWVRRSGRCPMAVAFDFEPDPELSSKGLLTSIASQRTRLEHLVLHLHHADGLHPFSGPMPRLHHLDLNFDDYNEFESDAVLVLSASDAPLLRTVLLTHNPATVALPWAQLTSLTLRDVFPSEFSQLLGQTPNLIFCHLKFILEDDDITPNPITLRHLASLKLEVKALYPIHDYLHAFTVPSLRCLETTEVSLGRDPLQSLALSMSRSGCNLQELIIRQKHGISRRAYRGAFPSVNCSFFGDGEESESSSTEGESSDEENSSESE
ncbi:hypothetical protein C8R46DRAFT_1340738 [Mycena filopes]|nr:hypothetical protein C8R46DRAFT_1340738 [Mycena filopes]